MQFERIYGGLRELSGILEDGRVYRLFGKPDEFIHFISGTWKGTGIHGLPEFASQAVSASIAGAGKKSVIVKLGNKKKILDFFTKRQNASFPKISLKLDLAEWTVGPDIALLENGEYKIEILSMNENEMYFLMEKLIRERRILFAGTLKKKLF